MEVHKNLKLLSAKDPVNNVKKNSHWVWEHICNTKQQKGFTCIIFKLVRWIKNMQSTQWKMVKAYKEGIIRKEIYKFTGK